MSDEPKEQEKILTLRKILGSKETLGSSKGLAWDLQSERTRFTQENRCPEFSVADWKALARTTRYPDNSSGFDCCRLSKACFEVWRIDNVLIKYLKQHKERYTTAKCELGIVSLELFECHPDDENWSSLHSYLTLKHSEYLAASSDYKQMEKIHGECIHWALEIFKNTKKVKEYMNDLTIQNFLQNICYENLMKVIIQSIQAHDKSESDLDQQYDIYSFKRKYISLQASDDSESFESEGSETTKVPKKPRRNEEDFDVHLKHCDYICPGVPGLQCLLMGKRLNRDFFEYDHIHPWRYSRNDDKSNKRPLCKNCHHYKTKYIDRQIKDDVCAITMLQTENKLPGEFIKTLPVIDM